jgi:hypothetical protein
MSCTSWTGRHKYQARYDEKEIPGALKTLTGINAIGDVDRPAREDYILRIYVQDVCVHCGDVVDRLKDDK